jgi:hypothetical protein
MRNPIELVTDYVKHPIELDFAKPKNEKESATDKAAIKLTAKLTPLSEGQVREVRKRTKPILEEKGRRAGKAVKTIAKKVFR